MQIKDVDVDVHVHPSPKDASPIFIIGNGRSGTTLMRLMLNAHPKIYIAEEINYHYVMKTYLGSFRRRLYDYFQSFSYAWLRMDPQVVLDVLPAKPEERDSAAVYLRILECKAAQYGKTRVGEKGPMLSLALDLLYRDYPNARVIHMVRDPRSVVYSHITMPWSTPSLLMANWMVWFNMKAIQRYGDRILNIKLEDVVAQPEATMRKVLAFVGEEWSDDILHHNEHLLPNDGIPFPWLNEAARRPKQKTITWKEVLSPTWIRMIENTNRETFKTFGYAPLPLPSEPSLWDKTRAVAVDLPQFVRTLWNALRLGTRFHLVPKSDARALQALMHSTNPAAWDMHPEWDRTLPEPPRVNPPRQLLE